MIDITEYDYLTNTVTAREYTNSEKEIVQNLNYHGQDLVSASEQEDAEKNLAKIEAIEALKLLGLTEAQARAISGL